jgi:phosphatidylglycerophosphate synthase
MFPLNLPNVLTVIRILLVPVVALLVNTALPSLRIAAGQQGIVIPARMI